MPSGHEAAAEVTPYFFLSHAHSRGLAPTDEFRRNRLVKRFQENLREAVRDAARAGTGGLIADMVESEMPLGDRWAERTSHGLARCRSFVALYSNEYFSTEHCGKEWQVFAGRVETDNVLRSGESRAIIPVLWQPVSDGAMPACARELPVAHLELGPTYSRYGLNYLLRHMSEHRDEYEAAVLSLARRIVNLAEHEPPVYVERMPDYAAVRNAFSGAGASTYQRPRIKILIAAPCKPRLPRGADPEMYGPQPADWKPYIPEYGGEIVQAARRLAESMDFQVVVESFEHSGEYRSSAMPSAPTLLIIDPWAAQDPTLQQRLSGFDARSLAKPWIRPVVAWNRGNPFSRDRETDLESRLRNTLQQCRRRYRPDSPQVLDGIETIHDFAIELPAVIRKAEQHYFSQIVREQSELAQPEEAPRRPRFSGPGPGLGQGGRAIKDSGRPEDPQANPRPPGWGGPGASPGYPPEQRGRYDFPNTEGQP
jgi:FxsC-like protein